MTDVPGHERTGTGDGAFEKGGVVAIGESNDRFRRCDLDAAGGLAQTAQKDVDFARRKPELRTLQDLVILGPAALVHDRTNTPVLDPVHDPPRRPMGGKDAG